MLCINYDQFESKFDPVLANGDGAPDVFGLEEAFVRKYVGNGKLNIDQWTEVWFTGTKDALYDDTGKLLEVFCRAARR